MKFLKLNNFSLRNRLLLQLGFITAILLIAIYLMVKGLMNQTITATQDKLLNVAMDSILEKVIFEDEGVILDLPYDVFSILGAIGEDSLFYRVDQGNKFLTGYKDLVKSKSYGTQREPKFNNVEFNGQVLRTISVRHIFSINNEKTQLNIIIGKTQNFKNSMLSKINYNLQIVGFGFLIISILLALITINSALKPINLLADAVKLRGPNDLRYVKYPTPVEVLPLLNALNDFISRLRGALIETEKFISEAAHHIRTPLATVKSESEIALRKSKSSENRTHLRNIIRSVDQTNRSSNQLLEHAMVLYRSEKSEKKFCDLNKLVKKIIYTLKTAADLRDVSIKSKINKTGEISFNLDQTLFEVALRNLIDNAIKYSPNESEILIETRLVENKSYEVEIINQTSQPIKLNSNVLTKKFIRGKNNQNVIGTGLGLAIVSEAIAILGGSFSFIQKKDNKICAILSLSLA